MLETREEAKPAGQQMRAPWQGATKATDEARLRTQPAGAEERGIQQVSTDWAIQPVHFF